MEKIQFTIPKPCHEDWNKMSPQEKGRFCDSCGKTVFDFSSWTPGEIKQYISEHRNEKLCGRFRNDQLRKPVRLKIYFRSFVNMLNYSQSFFMSLLIAFGTSLLSCKTNSENKLEEISLTMDGPDSIITNDENEIVKEHPPVHLVDGLPKLRIKSITQLPERLDTTVDLPQVDVEGEAIKLVCSFTMGAIARTTTIYNSGKVLEDSSSEQNNMQDENTDQFDKDFVVYPNPVHGIMNIKFHLPEDKIIDAELFDMNGRLIRTLIQSKQMAAGENDLQFDVSDLPPSTYLLSFIKEGMMETKRVVVL